MDARLVKRQPNVREIPANGNVRYVIASHVHGNATNVCDRRLLAAASALVQIGFSKRSHNTDQPFSKPTYSVCSLWRTLAGPPANFAPEITGISILGTSRDRTGAASR